MSATEILLVGSSNTIEVRGLRDAISLSYQNAATVTITLKDAAGNNVSGETWPFTLSYVASSDGIYRGTLAAALGIVAGRTYYGHITATQGGSTRFWKKPFIAMVGSE